MATNPMRKQARTSFLLGVVLTLLISAVIVVLLFMQLKEVKEENEAFKSEKVKVYALMKDVNSGDTLTSDMFGQVDAVKSSIPADYAEVTSLLSAYSLYTKDGKPITSEYTAADSSTKVQTQHLYLNGDKNAEIFRDETTGSYYKMNKNEKEYIDTVEAPVIAKIGAKRNTIISQSLVARSNEIDTDDVREQEYNMLVLPTDLMTGDYIDVRLQLPNGQDYIVVSKKKVTVPDVSGEYLTDTIQVKMAEEEILTMSNAIVEAYKIEGSKLYATKYTEAGLQEASSPTYVVNEFVVNLIAADPNIVSEAKSALAARYNASNGALKTMRTQNIESVLQSQENANENEKQKMEESITSTQESRQKYLQSLVQPQTTTGQ